MTFEVSVGCSAIAPLGRSLRFDIEGLCWLQQNTLYCCVYQTHRCSVHGDELLPDCTITPR
ncbi:hypothetical protein B296_00050840 [Ensete ventricosum]|uniref:Uncharacterized protein n=1 Tax=Ensete ventricosum TaxID=4639 RepID=A0A426X9W0_ENSVE|nr:hypothetical protein B296_00050840 [Ensete ventricosum]